MKNIEKIKITIDATIKQALKISKETIKDYVEKYPSVLSKVGIDKNGRIEPKL